MKKKQTNIGRNEPSAPMNKIDVKVVKKNPIYSDVNGSYTGRPFDGGRPVQDADDL